MATILHPDTVARHLDRLYRAASETWLAARASASPVAVLAARDVYAAIAALPDDQRDVVAAVDLAGLSYLEAAALLAIPAGTVMSRLYRGRNRVAAQVG